MANVPVYYADYEILTLLGTFVPGVISNDYAVVYGAAPELGYFISDRWAVGLAIGFHVYDPKNSGDTITTLGANPYVRWYCYKHNKLSLYGQLGGTYQYSHNSINLKIHYIEAMFNTKPLSRYFLYICKKKR